MHKRHGSKSGLRHVYVAMMAVDPSAQGQKLCSKLMRTVSKVADAKGLPCYLECSGEKNREVYRRFGYEVAERCSVKDPGGGPGFDEYYAMVRKSTKSV
jgi:predicted N-acetyltransferase YhbS